MNKILQLNPDDYIRFISFLVKAMQLLINIYNKFVKDAGLARAGSLAFSTLMAAVPFAALTISLMNAFGALDTVQQQIMDFIVQLLIPTRQLEVNEILNQFLDNSRTLGVVGLVFFTITSIMLLNTITKNLNAVWGSKAKTNFISKFTTYASVIIFGTLLIAASTTLTSRFTFFETENIADLSRILIKVAPFVFDFFVIMLLIGLTPSARVRLRYLLIVSAVGAVFWELLKHAFFNVSSWVLRMSVIYGTIAIVPIFLFWVYVIWLIILGAMETAWVLQYKNKAWEGKPIHEMTPYEKLTFGYELFISIAHSYENGLTPPNAEQLSGKFSVSIRDVHDMTALLSSGNLLMQAGDDGQGWVPARSLSKIKTSELIEVIFGTNTLAENGTAGIHLQIERFRSGGINGIDQGCISDLLTAQKN